MHIFLLILAIIIVIFLDNVDATAVNLALPQMTSEFHLSTWMIQWIINGYLISSACFFIIGGKLGDVFGKRKIYIIGLSIFILTSLWASISNSSWSILSARTFQGLGFAMTYPMSIIILSTAFPKDKQVLAMGLVVGASGLSIAALPILGGFILHWLNWRAIFAVNIPLGLVAVLIVSLIIKDLNEPGDRHFSDIKGCLLLLIGLFYLIYTINLNDSIHFYITLSQMIIAIGFISWFFIHEYHTKKPLLNLEIFNHDGYFFANIVRMLYQFIFIGLLFILPVTFQNLYNVSALHLGLIIFPLTMLMGIGSPLVGKWVTKIGAIVPIRLSCTIMFSACLWLSLMPLDLSIIYVEIGLTMIGIAFALAFPALNTIAITGHQAHLSGQASGLYYMNAAVAGSLGVGCSVWILKAVTQLRAEALLSKKLIPFASGLRPIKLSNYSPHTINLLQLIFHRGWVVLFCFYALIMLISLFFSLCYSKK